MNRSQRRDVIMCYYERKFGTGFSPVPICMFIFISVNFLFDELKSDDILRTLLPIIFFGRGQNEKGEENLCDTY